MTMCHHVRMCLALGAVVVVSAVPAALGAGKVEVRVTASPHPDLKPPKKDEYSGLPVGGPYAARRIDYKKIDGIAVSLAPVADVSLPAPAPARLEVKRVKLGAPVPFTAVAINTEITLVNRTGSPQTIYSVSDGNTFTAENVAPGAEARFTAGTAGLVEVLCESENDPLLQIYVAPARLVRVVRSGESVTFADLPPGEYRLVTWHRRLPGVTRHVSVTDKETTRLDASVGMKDAELPKAP